jgi:UDP-N-acetylenolpyruvoylglucosamine reductase
MLSSEEIMRSSAEKNAETSSLGPARLGTQPKPASRDWAAELLARISTDSVVRPDEPLARRTTLRVGGRADVFVEPASEDDLARVLQFCAQRHLPFTVLGRGSNLLIKDGGIRGVVICLNQPVFNRIEVQGPRLRCGAGVKLKAVAIEARKHGLSGLEFLEGIPGSVGGALRMNAGAMGSWTFEVVEAVRFMEAAGLVHQRPAGELNPQYRSCAWFKDHIALAAIFKGQPAPREVIAERMKTFSQKRWDTQPPEPSAGCIFKNPTTIPAGKLIDELGLKGTRVGDAVVSRVHGNFIVNEGHATAKDVLDLIHIIQARAKSQRGIDLETEVEILGE